MGVVGGAHSQSKGNASRGRPYAVMLLLAFGAALLGVMLLHKFRERRICNLLLSQTHQHLLSLHLLFQKQSDRNKELEKNNEDMKAMVYSLRTQKMELDRRLLEMQSTIDSLRDEQKTIDVALQERQNEIKMLRETEVESGKEDHQVLALTESLKQKEAELEDLRHRLQSQATVGSVATDGDDPSNPRVHRNQQLLETGRFKVGENESMDNGRRERRSADFSEGKTSNRVDIGTREFAEPSSEDEDEDEEVGDGDERKVDGKGSAITIDHKEAEVQNRQEVENQKPDGVLKIGMKKETGTGSGKYGQTEKIKGKRWRHIAMKRRLDDQWRLISKNRNSDGSGVQEKGHQREFLERGASTEEKMKREHQKELEAVNSLDSAITDSLKHQLKVMGEGDREEEQMEKEGQMFRPEQFNSTEGDILSEVGEQKQDDEQSGNGEVENSSIDQNLAEKVEAEEFKTKEKEEQKGDAEERDTGESSLDVKGEYKEETDESEY